MKIEVGESLDRLIAGSDWAVARSDFVIRRLLDAIRASAFLDLSVTRVCRTAGLNPRIVQRRLRSLLGSTLKPLLDDLRIDAAKRLLKGTSMKEESIAASVGLGDAHSFRRVFLRRAGMLPSQYRDSDAPSGAGGA